MRYIARIKDENRTANVFYVKHDGLSSYEVVYLEDKINKGTHYFNTQVEAVQSARLYTSDGVMP